MPNASPERRIHLAVLGYLRLRLPDAAIHHSANEIGLAGKAVARQIAKAKHMGMMVGFPDLMVLWRGQALFFEVKAPGNYPTEAQKAAHELLTANGAQCHVVRSVGEVETILGGIPGEAQDVASDIALERLSTDRSPLTYNVEAVAPAPKKNEPDMGGHPASGSDLDPNNGGSSHGC